MNNNRAFKRIIIDKYKGPEIIDFSDIKPHYGTGQAYRIPHQYKKLYGYRNGIQTDIGDIEVSEWRRLVRRLIKTKGEQELFNQLLEWEKEHWVSENADGITQHTLELHASRIFENEGWYYFIPFNERYYPEKLAFASIVTVVTDCCQTQLQMTEKQIERAFKQCIHCPACREYTTVTLIQNSKK